MDKFKDILRKHKDRMDQLKKARKEALGRRNAITHKSRSRSRSISPGKTKKIYDLLPAPPTHAVKIQSANYNLPLAPTHAVKIPSPSTQMTLMLMKEFGDTPRGRSKSPKSKSKSNKGGKTAKRHAK